MIKNKIKRIADNIENIIKKTAIKIYNNIKQYKFITGTIVAIIFFVLPILCTNGYFKYIAKLLFNNKENAIGYLQYIGSLVGGIATLVAVIITTKQAKKHQNENLSETRKIQQENKKLHDEDINRQRLADSLICIPIFDIHRNQEGFTLKNIPQHITLTAHKNIIKDKTNIDFFIRLTNIGAGPCKIKGFTVVIMYNDNQSEEYTVEEGSNNIIMAKDKKYYNISYRYKNEKEEDIVNPLTLKIKFEDILTNKYIQEIRFKLEYPRIDIMDINLPQIIMK